MEKFIPERQRQILATVQKNSYPGGPLARAAFQRLYEGTETEDDRNRIIRQAILERYGKEDMSDQEPVSPPQQDLNSLWDNGPTLVEDAARYVEIFDGLVRKSRQYFEIVSRKGRKTLRRKTPYGKMSQEITPTFVNGVHTLAVHVQDTLRDRGAQKIVNEIEDRYEVYFSSASVGKVIFETNKNKKNYQKGGDIHE